MDAIIPGQNRIMGRQIALLLMSSVIISACATTQSSRTPARIDIHEEVGFTIGIR